MKYICCPHKAIHHMSTHEYRTTERSEHHTYVKGKGSGWINHIVYQDKKQTKFKAKSCYEN